MEANDKIIKKQIETLLAKLLTVTFGYCGMAVSENKTILNSGESIKITIETKSEAVTTSEAAPEETAA